MANIDLRINPASDIGGIKALRRNRKNNKGLWVNTSTGFSSRDRRDVIDQADSATPSLTPAIIRRRLRRGWTLQSALTTAQA